LNHEVPDNAVKLHSRHCIAQLPKYLASPANRGLHTVLNSCWAAACSITPLPVTQLQQLYTAAANTPCWLGIV
jgi:hypothetical protein